MKIPLEKINKEWTLFLDRDGVINEEKYMDYIHTVDEFKFMPGVLKAFEIFSKKFNRIIIVTNQRGVGTGVTKEKDLLLIHEIMQAEIKKNNGRTDAVYYCSSTDNDHSHRKPNAGMGLAAVQDFPDIDFTKAIMVGNTISDMQFGRNLGVHTVFLPTTRPEVLHDDPDIDAVYPSLLDFALAI
jgi:D-glycero-D-manno-heptose 1,7-bisphosphate phosphatase